MKLRYDEKVIEEFPAYVVVERAVDDRRGAVEILVGDRLGLREPAGRFYREFSPGSVAAYALQYNEDPIAAVANAQARGHKLHWINGVGASLTAEKREQWKLVKVEVGMKVYFQGRVFEIQAAPNNNLELAELANQEA